MALPFLYPQPIVVRAFFQKAVFPAVLAENRRAQKITRYKTYRPQIDIRFAVNEFSTGRQPHKFV